MNNLQDLVSTLHLENIITREDIPAIDLYMDQVTQLFERTYEKGKRHDTDKVLTKTMINNYAKGKLLFPIKNKRYTKEHIMLIQFIYQLKGALSINDVRTTLYELNNLVEAGEINLDDLYDRYTTLTGAQVEEFKASIDALSEEVEQAKQELNDEGTGYIEQLLMIVSLVHYSNMYRKLAEQLVESLYGEQVKDEKK